jgi:membrane protease YdiL (CAAX protease family)
MVLMRGQESFPDRTGAAVTNGFVTAKEGSERNKVSTTVRLIVGLLLAFVVLMICGATTSVAMLAQSMKPSPWTSAVTQGTMLILSIILIYLFSKGAISTYGLKSVKLRSLLWPALIGLGVRGALAGVGYLLQLDGEPDFMKEFSLLQIVILILIFASIAEEFLTRGFLLSFLAPLSRHGLTVFKLYFSLPVLVSALFFGLMHIALLGTGAKVPLVLFVICSAIVLGIMAGYFREKTGSIVPAIVIHMMFNVWGVVEKLVSRQ